MQTRWVVWFWFHATNIRGLLRALRSRNSLTCSKQPLNASCITSRQAGHLAFLVCQLRRVSAHEHSWIAACARLARCVLTALLIMVFMAMASSPPGSSRGGFAGCNVIAHGGEAADMRPMHDPPRWAGSVEHRA